MESCDADAFERDFKVPMPFKWAIAIWSQRLSLTNKVFPRYVVALLHEHLIATQVMDNTLIKLALEQRLFQPLVEIPDWKVFTPSYGDADIS